MKEDKNESRISREKIKDERNEKEWPPLTFPQRKKERSRY
jgi:hypothetical protein